MNSLCGFEGGLGRFVAATEVPDEHNLDHIILSVPLPPLQPLGFD